MIEEATGDCPVHAWVVVEREHFLSKVMLAFFNSDVQDLRPVFWAFFYKLYVFHACTWFGEQVVTIHIFRQVRAAVPTILACKLFRLLPFRMAVHFDTWLVERWLLLCLRKGVIVEHLKASLLDVLDYLAQLWRLV